MRLAYLFFAVSLLRSACAQSPFADVPECALLCTLSELEKYGCDISNTTSIIHCVCTNHEVKLHSSKCVRTTCNITDIIAAQDAQDEMCAAYPIETRQPQIIIFSSVLMFIVIVFVALRCWSRYHVTKEFWWDDWVTLLAAAVLTALQAVTIWGAKLGFGLHVWNINPLNEQTLYEYLWTYELLYATIQALSKISVLLLYRRIFPQNWLRRTVIIFCIAIIIQFIIFTCATLFLCRPIALVYNKLLKGKCLSLNAITLWGGVICFLEDFIILMLPVPSILRLRLRWRRKLGVLAIMCVGTVASIASIVRLRYIVGFSSSLDQNWDDYIAALYSSLELSLSMICICIPAIKPLLNQWFPTYFGSSGSNPNPTLSFNLHDTEAIIEDEASWQIRVFRKMKRSLGSVFTRSKRSAGGSGSGENGGRETPWRDSKTAAGLGTERVEEKEKISGEVEDKGIELSETDVSAKV